MLPTLLARLRYSAKQVRKVTQLHGNQRTINEVLCETTCDDFFAMFDLIDYPLEPLHSDIIIIARGGSPS